MTEYPAPQLRALFDAVTVPSALFSGIQGDRSHTYGYHRGRAYCDRGDYSTVISPYDTTGDDQVCCALDIHLSAADMQAVTSRLMQACKSGDPRTRAIREFFGTQDGATVTGWDRHNPDVAGDDGFTTSDDSHLWHVHISIYRSMVGYAALVLPIAGVINGTATTAPEDDVSYLQWPAADRKALAKDVADELFASNVTKRGGPAGSFIAWLMSTGTRMTRVDGAVMDSRTGVTATGNTSIGTRNALADLVATRTASMSAADREALADDIVKRLVGEATGAHTA